jgi:hypothetical protein
MERVELCAVGGCGNRAVEEVAVAHESGNQLEVPLCADHPEITRVRWGAPSPEDGHGMNIMDLAYVIHERKCDLWRGLPLSADILDGDPRIAQPFGRPLAMPEHHWRVSWDVMQALHNASPPPHPVPNPKTSHGATKVLLGWPVEVDRDAPPGTMLLLVSD